MKKVAKKKRASKKLPVVSESDLKLEQAIECLKQYTKKELIGDLANPAIELLTKWGKL
jgi:hypothetical protein